MAVPRSAPTRTTAEFREPWRREPSTFVGGYRRRVRMTDIRRFVVAALFLVAGAWGCSGGGGAKGGTGGASDGGSDARPDQAGERRAARRRRRCRPDAADGGPAGPRAVQSHSSAIAVNPARHPALRRAPRRRQRQRARPRDARDPARGPAGGETGRGRQRRPLHAGGRAARACARFDGTHALRHRPAVGAPLCARRVVGSDAARRRSCARSRSACWSAPTTPASSSRARRTTRWCRFTPPICRWRARRPARANRGRSPGRRTARRCWRRTCWARA